MCSPFLSGTAVFAQFNCLCPLPRLTFVTFFTTTYFLPVSTCVTRPHSCSVAFCTLFCAQRSVSQVSHAPLSRPACNFTKREIQNKLNNFSFFFLLFISGEPFPLCDDVFKNRLASNLPQRLSTRRSSRLEVIKKTTLFLHCFYDCFILK